MKIFIQTGDYITLAAPAAVTSGDGVLVGSLFGVATGNAENGADVVLSTVRVYTLPKKTADALTVGEVVYWDDANSEVTETATNNAKIGVAIAAAGAGAGVTTTKVRLNGTF